MQKSNMKTGSGVERAAARLKAKLKANKKIPHIERPDSRQVRRHLERKGPLQDRVEYVGHTRRHLGLKQAASTQ